jgi:signal transduction histidine kinase
MGKFMPAYPARPDNDLPDWLAGGGEMAKLIKATDWSRTPLGPIESWPQSLRTVVSLAQASNSPISLAWGPHHVQIYNDGYWPICGDKHPTSMGQDFRECWAAPWPVIGEAYASACAGKTAYLENMRMFLDRYGFLEETWFTFSFSPITDESGKVAGLFHPVTELTGQSLSERRTKTLRDLVASAGKSKTVQEAFDASAHLFAESNLDLPFVLFYLVDEAGRTAQLAALTSLPAGTSISPLAVDLQTAGIQPWPIAEVVRTGHAQHIDDVVVRLAGLRVGPYEELPRMAFALPITLPGQERPAAVMVAGVSPRLRMDEPYRGFIDLVAASVSAALANARAHEDERRKAEALAEIDRAKTAFFSNVSHEFRTPLTLMLGPLEDELNEREHPLPEARRERIETAHRNSLRLLKLVNGLLDFSRIEAGRVHASYEPTDLAALTAELASNFRSAIERGGLTLSVDCPPLPEPIYVDREMWEKIVFNLLSNAFKHTFQGGIGVRVAWLDGAVELSVQDSGVGIAADELPKLFERFHRVKGAASRTHEGTGIGLSLARELVLLHGGSIRTESDLGKGSCFIVTLKAGNSHLPADKIGRTVDIAATGRHSIAFVQEALHWLPSTPDAGTTDEMNFLDPIPAPAEPESKGPRPRILWADDNADMRQYVMRLLDRAYEVQAVADGMAALDAARSAPPDLVLSDVMMPRLDGFGLLNALRADERTRTIPVILLSARAGEESAVEGLDAGADDYLVKPFSARELLARVRTHLEMAKVRREWQTELELRVQERTAELVQTTRELEAEIAERERAEQKLRETQESAMQQERLRALGQIASGIAHDINNAISPIALYAESLLERESSLSDRARGQITIIQRAIEDVAQTVARMREFYRKREPELVLAQVDLNRIVKEGIALTRARWSDVPQQRGVVIDLRTDLSADLTDTAGAENEIRDALTNLIFNAVDAMPEGGMLTLRTRITQKGDEAVRHACVEVCDTGVGMDDATRTRCLEPFFTTKGERGTGLGLAMVYGMVKRHSAELEIDSEPGKGTTMRIIFPAALGMVMPAAHLPEIPKPVRSLRILIVDDDPMVLRSLKDALEGDGHLVTSADSGQAGIDTFVAAKKRGESFAVVITDLGMPHVDGSKVATTVRAASPATPIIMLTGWGQRLVTDNDVPPQVDRVLGKPPKLRELRAALAELIPETASVTNEPPSKSAINAAHPSGKCLP